MSIKDLNLISAVSIQANANLHDAVSLMLEKRINYLPVIDHQHIYLGMISIYDIIQRLLPLGVGAPHGLQDLKFAGDAIELLRGKFNELPTHKVTDLLNEVTPAINEDCPVLEAAFLLTNHARPMAVISNDKKLVGALSAEILLKSLI